MFILMGVTATATILGKIHGSHQGSKRRKLISNQTEIKSPNFLPSYEFDCYFSVVRDGKRPLPLPGPIIRNVVSKRRQKKNRKEVLQLASRLEPLENSIPFNRHMVIAHDQKVVALKKDRKNKGKRNNKDGKIDDSFSTKAGAILAHDLIVEHDKRYKIFDVFYLKLKSCSKK
eukprot:Awhi_evm1s11406